MPPRRLGVAVTAASLLAAVPPSNAAELPRAVCSKRLNDDAGDAKYSLQGAKDSQVRDPNQANVEPLDIRGVTLRHTPDYLEAYVAVTKVEKAFATHETAYQYDVMFENVDGSKFKLTYTATNPFWDPAPTGKAPPTPPAKASWTVGTTTTTFDEVTHEVDRTNNVVILRVPRDQFDRAWSAPVKQGDVLSKLSAKTYTFIYPYAGTSSLRETDNTAVYEPGYTVGDDFCFGLMRFGATATQFGDPSTLTAMLVDGDGNPAAGKSVKFTVGEAAPVSGTTNAAGVASIPYVSTLPAGTHPVVVSFAGDESTPAATDLAGELVIKPEVTAFAPLTFTRPTTKTRVVTATLLDDDKKAVAGQSIVWYVNGRKVATYKSDSRGRSVYKGAKPGQTVQARFVTVAGKYTGAASKSLKV